MGKYNNRNKKENFEESGHVEMLMDIITIKKQKEDVKIYQ